MHIEKLYAHEEVVGDRDFVAGIALVTREGTATLMTTERLTSQTGTNSDVLAGCVFEACSDGSAHEGLAVDGKALDELCDQLEPLLDQVVRGRVYTYVKGGSTRTDETRSLTDPAEEAWNRALELVEEVRWIDENMCVIASENVEFDTGPAECELEKISAMTPDEIREYIVSSFAEDGIALSRARLDVTEDKYVEAASRADQ